MTAILRQLGSVPAEERPRLGQVANEIKAEIERRFEERKQELGSLAGPKFQGIDCSLPGRYLPFGSLHPITQVMEEICAIFAGMGFAVAEGPDVETDHYNFEALNIPKQLFLEPALPLCKGDCELFFVPQVRLFRPCVL